MVVERWVVYLVIHSRGGVIIINTDVTVTYREVVAARLPCNIQKSSCQYLVTPWSDALARGHDNSVTHLPYRCKCTKQYAPVDF